jgi:hypothetical protein
MYTGFHLPPISAAYGVRTEQFSIWTLDLDDPPLQREASEKVETPGEMKTSVHTFTTVYHVRGGGGRTYHVIYLGLDLVKISPEILSLKVESPDSP